MSQAISVLFMKGTGPNLIEKILFKTIFLLTGRIYADNSTKIFLGKINMLLDPPLEKINKYKLNAN